jgi:hypothetical protein
MTTDDEGMRDNWPELRAKFAGYTFHHYRAYVQRTTKLIEQEAVSLDRQLEEARLMRGRGPEEKGIAISRRMEESQWFKFHFHRMAYKSVFVSIYSHFEQVLVEFCDDLRKARRFKIAVDDLGSGDTIGRCRTYLMKVGDVPFPNAAGWSDIKLVQQARNKIVHNAGLFQALGTADTKETTTLRQFLMRKGGQEWMGETVSVSEQFLLYSIDLFSAFVVELANVTPAS